MDAAIFGPVFTFSCLRRSLTARQWGAVVISIFAVAVPFIAWDIVVTGEHWCFDERFVLGLGALGLPIEEWLFFVAVPFACLFLWIAGFRHRGDFRASPRPVGLRIGLGLIALSAFIGWTGPPYSALCVLVLGIFIAGDCRLGAAVSTHRSAPLFAVSVVLLTAVFDGFLTARPVVHYAPSAICGLRIGSIPIEDFGYGLALVGSVVAVFEATMRRR